MLVRSHRFVNGKYYFYVSAGGAEVGVVVADTIEGSVGSASHPVHLQTLLVRLSSFGCTFSVVVLALPCHIGLVGFDYRVQACDARLSHRVHSSELKCDALACGCTDVAERANCLGQAVV
jgi:hypothetical protein